MDIYQQKLWIDFETYSEVDITKEGRKKYTHHDSTNILMMGWAINNNPVQLWTPRYPLPEEIIDHVSFGYSVYAFNAIFEYGIWNVCGRELLGFPALSLEQLVDVQALCKTYTLPGSLGGAGEVMKLRMPKEAEGKKLIKLCCTPDKYNNQPQVYNTKLFYDLGRYCIRDVEAMRELTYKLPKQTLLPIEQKVWELTVEMNDRGLPIDEVSVHAILKYLNKYVKEETRQIPKLCGNAFQKVTQVAKFIEWCKEQGYTLPNLQAETVEKALKDDHCPSNVKKMLELRQELGRTSTAKYQKIADQIYEEKVYDNVAYHMASTGRWGGRGFQMHNLPRAKVKDPEKYIEMFINNEVIEDPVGIGKALIRPMVCAPPGYKLIVSDYSSIENRILAWLAGDEVTLQDFRDGLDQYKIMAAARFGKAYNDVTEEERLVGKILILGAGYGLGWRGYINTCELWGLKITKDAAKIDIDAYRTKYSLVKELWKELKLACTRAVLSGKRQTYGHITFGTARVNGTRWLAMRLPSEKSIYYCEPWVEDKYIPGYESMGKVPTVRHWGINPYTKKWSRLSLIPGRITENADQATARECMAYGLLNIKKRMPEVKLLGSVHDEAIGIIRDEDIREDTLDTFSNLLCDIPFMKGCPLKAKGYIAKRYRKD